MPNLDEQARLAAIVASSDDAIIAKSLAGTILDWNRGATRLFGYSSREAVGKKITLIVPRDLLKDEMRILKRLRAGKPVEHYETLRLTKDGRRLLVSISISLLRDEKGKISAASTIIRDISSSKQAETAVRESEQRLRAIFEAAADSMITIDERGVVESVNPAVEELFGYRASELLGRNINCLMPEPFHTQHDGYLRNYIRTGVAKIIGIGREVTGRRKDGTTFPVSLSVSEVRLGQRRLFTGILHDLSGRRALERQIIEAAANEQRRIGQDLHDGLCQDLVGLAFTIDHLGRTLPPEANGVRQQVEELSVSMRAAAAQARDLSHGLNPVDINAGGLTVALDGLAKKVSRSFNVRCTFRSDGATLVSDDATATHLYRIAQEAVSNAIRHGKANAVEISLESKDGFAAMSVSDNGSGMSASVANNVRRGLTLWPPPASGGGASSGMGLQTMQYRARVIGGAFTVLPRRGRGTTVQCTFVPISAARAPMRSPRKPAPRIGKSPRS